MAYWQKKIAALLHDPPDKALRIGGHKDRASVLVQMALRSLPDVPPTGIPDAAWVEAANRADIIAAATDRLNFPAGVEVLDWTKEENSLVVHPLSGQRWQIRISTSPEEAADAQSEVVKILSEKSNNPVERFLLLWRYLEDEFHQREPRLIWEALPADTRIPNHSILHHNRVASAFATIQKPATLIFSIGPVQGFIVNARKTRDLWIGSYLLSYLTWQAIKVVAEELGPEQILYPSLLEQPLVDFWLSEKFSLADRPPEKRLRLATFPNKFTAVVPAEEAEAFARRCESAVRGEWERLTGKIRERLVKEIPSFASAQGIWERQVRQFPEVYWATYEWGEQPEIIASLYEELTGSEHFVEVLKLQQGAYPHNQGTVYAACHELVERALAARKVTRDFEEIDEPGWKCTMCGEREILHDDRDGRGKDFWKEVALRLGGHFEPDGRERLCAICTVKRLIQPLVFRDELSLRGDFPSTDSMAVAPLVKTALERWENETRTIVETLIGVIGSCPLQRIAFAGMDIPELERLAEQRGETARRLVSLDGNWLFAESYNPERLERVYGVKLSNDEAQTLRKTLKDLCNATSVPLSDYYAILVMDGDNMGKWLSGTHENLARFGAMLHPKASEQLKDIGEWQELLQQKRLISPSLHVAISQALANFALHCVPFVIEELHCGRLVYAGGDDVLAFLPLQEVLDATRELRALFSGEAGRKPEGGIEIVFGDNQWTGWLDWNGRKLLTMGNKATASVGIAIAHRLHSLRDALQQARDAEKDAKNRYGRNAICIRWLKRSGERVQMGAKFTYPDSGIQDTLDFLLGVKEVMKGKDEVEISGRFATALMEEAFTLVNLPAEAQEAELLRLLRRHSKGDSKAKEKVLPELAHNLGHLANALEMHAGGNTIFHDLTKPQRGLIELGKWLTFLRFLGGGGA